ncbi:conserved membrane hypothetical protein [Rubrivivax sp. A210]|uniref:DUF4231 domain-containing protein n=1 Tax=Rubrivivax sp. A210 TaxID=2772301 RepID=UPI00191894FC|nr:DUF4231 domain-containing protein [Rubrivivax sp. A210]CAD5373217.1 conserved membrane hypothetical protein [Rubrivivax sp. A210]
MATPQDSPSPSLTKQGPDDTPATLAQALALDGFKSVVVLADGHQDVPAAMRARVTQLLGRGLLRAARDAQALCVLRGASDDLLGPVLADSQGGLLLLGVAPAGRVQLPGEAAAADAPVPAPLLTRLLLTPEGPWGSELRTKVQVAGALAAGRAGLLVVVGNGAGLMVEVREAVRLHWPVLVVKGSGDAADALERQWTNGIADEHDPVVAEILADGNLTCITLGDKVAEAVETMTRQVLRGTGGESVLLQAWRRFGAIDLAAKKQQTDFKETQFLILVLGLVAVYLSIVYSGPADPLLAGLGLSERWASGIKSALNFALILVPIGTSVLIAASNHFKPGKRWVLLRSAAESIKREIYRYRLRAADYSDVGDAREKKLAEAVEDITRRLARTEANTTALPIYTDAIPPEYAAHPLDRGMSMMSTDQYVAWRLRDQLGFYRKKTVGLEQQLRRLQIYVLVAGAGGTLLAALGGQAVIWITFTTALAGAIVTYLGYQQVETTLTSYNQTATDLDNILTWWTSLEPEEQAQRDNLDALVTHTEQVLADELAGWTQRMTDALEKLRETQTQKEAARRDERSKADAAAAEAAAAAEKTAADLAEQAAAAAAINLGADAAARAAAAAAEKKD